MNVARRAAGKPPATNVWLWGLGSTPHLTPFAELYGKQGAMITAVDLLRGLATLIGWRRIEVPGATGYLDTDYAAKGRYAVEALEGRGPGLRSRRGDRRGLARRQRGRQGEGAGRDRPAHRRPAPRGAEDSTASIAFWSRPTIPRRCGRRRTATATCRLRWPAATSRPTRPPPTTTRRPAARRWCFTKAGG